MYSVNEDRVGWGVGGVILHKSSPFPKRESDARPYFCKKHVVIHISVPRIELREQIQSLPKTVFFQFFIPSS